MSAGRSAPPASDPLLPTCVAAEAASKGSVEADLRKLCAPDQWDLAPTSLTMYSVSQRTFEQIGKALTAPFVACASARLRTYAALSDAHFLGALLAAVPVWLALGLVVGAHMQMLVGWRAWVGGVLVQALMEEWVFRGLLQSQLFRLSAGRRIALLSWANLCTTGVFVAVHLVAQPLAWALAVALPSLVLGHLRDRFGSPWPGVLVHAYYNAGFWLTAWWVGS